MWMVPGTSPGGTKPMNVSGPWPSDVTSHLHDGKRQKEKHKNILHWLNSQRFHEPYLLLLSFYFKKMLLFFFTDLTIVKTTLNQ